MGRKLSPSTADPGRAKAGLGNSHSGNRKSTAGAGAKRKGSTALLSSPEKSTVCRRGSGKDSNVGFKCSTMPTTGKRQQLSRGEAGAGRNGSTDQKHRVLSNSTSASRFPSSSIASNHQPKSSPCSNREARSSTSTAVNLCHVDLPKSSKVVGSHKPASVASSGSEGLPRCSQPGEKTRAYSLGNIYRRVVNSDVYSKEASGVNAVSGPGGNGVPYKEVQTAQKNNHVLGFGGGNYGHGNIVKGGNMYAFGPSANCVPYSEVLDTRPSRGGATCCRNMEELKNVGNAEYRKGHFLEAISFYDKAIALCPRNAACHSNKAAALAGLGLYEKAVGECLEAISCDSSYLRAHYRLGNLYARLGRVEDARWHLTLSGECPGTEAMQKIQRIEAHVTNARNARSAEDWSLLLTESSSAIDSGADACSQMLAFKAEAMLKLHKVDEALELLRAARESRMKKPRKVRKCHACLLIVEIQIDMYLGRFEDGVAAAEHLVGLDARPESFMWLRKARTAADARKTGNELYKAEKYLEACNAYELGLQHVPANGVLLSDRAACRCKLGQWKMAVEDCNAALKNRPEYTKALLRRAHANAKLGNWEESLKDYKSLNQKMPDDVGISHALIQVQMKIKRTCRQSDKYGMGGQVTHLNNYTLFLKFIQCAGFALLQFFMKSDDRCKQLSPLVNDLSRRYPSWSFLKVDVEENPDWVKIASVKIVPIFIIYKDGHKLKEICKPDQQVLEHALQFHSALVA